MNTDEHECKTMQFLILWKPEMPSLDWKNVEAGLKAGSPPRVAAPPGFAWRQGMALPHVARPAPASWFDERTGRDVVRANQKAELRGAHRRSRCARSRKTKRADPIGIRPLFQPANRRWLVCVSHPIDHHDLRRGVALAICHRQGCGGEARRRK